MTSRISTALLVAVTGLSALALPGLAHAATVGYYGNCGNGSKAAAITAAGHTPVAVGSLDAASLAPLAALMSEDCGYPANAAVDNAVANGMVLIVHDWSPSYSQATTQLPGRPVLSLTYDGGGTQDVEFPAGSPIVTGPGGTLTNTTMDNGYSSYHGHATLASLPAGSTVLNTTNNPAQVVTFSYPHGSGRVVYSATPLGHYLVGGNGTGGAAPVIAGMQAYAANLVAWAVGPQFTTCAAEGFTRTKLTLCRQVCEIDQSPSRLTGLIRLYMAIYRSEPPCAR